MVAQPAYSTRKTAPAQATSLDAILGLDLGRAFSPERKLEPGPKRENCRSAGSSSTALHLAPAEIADVLSVSISTVRRLISSGRLPAVKIGGSVRITNPDLQAFLDARLVGSMRAVQSSNRVMKTLPD